MHTKKQPTKFPLPAALKFSDCNYFLTEAHLLQHEQLPPLHPLQPSPLSSFLKVFIVALPEKNTITASAITTTAFPIIDAISHLLSN